MAEELHIHDDLPISPGTGWIQMESLLNRTLPVKQKPSGARLLMACLPALLMCGIFLFSSLKLGNQFFYLTTAARQPVIKNAGEVHTDLKQDITATVRVAKHLIMHNNVVNTIRLDEPKTAIETFYDYAGGINNMEKISHAYFSKIFAARKNNTAIIVTAPGTLNRDLHLSDGITASEKLPAKQWELAAGIAMNIAPGKHQNLQPYPVAEVKYNLNRRFFVAAGLSFLSPKQGNLSGVSKTVYVNDTPSNIKLYNSVIRYDRLRYADVPLTAGVNIGKKISVQAGLQVSVLVSKRQSESLQPYDFQMNNLDMQYTAPLVGMAANPEQNFKLGTPAIDYRFTSAIKYQTGKNIIAGLSYQHGLQGNGAWKNNTGKGLFSFNLMYKIK